MPAASMVLGRRDAVVVLSLRLLRRGTWLVIPLGASLALLAGISQDRLASQYDTLSEWVHALVSPLWLLTIGILLRLAVAPVAYLAAVVVAILGPRGVQQVEDQRNRWSRATDVIRVAGGLRALRWTVAVRDEAVTLTGGSGKVLRAAEAVIGWLIVVAWTGFGVIVVVGTT